MLTAVLRVETPSVCLPTIPLSGVFDDDDLQPMLARLGALVA